MHVWWRKPCQLPGWMKNSSYYSAMAEARPYQLPPPQNDLSLTLYRVNTY